MQSKIKIALTGLNGYGAHFLESLLDSHELESELTAVVSQNPTKSPYYKDLTSKGIHIYNTLEQCLMAQRIDLVIISTPMHIHYDEIRCALMHGSHVYCEKPLAPTIDQCLALKHLAKEKNLLVSVGFQWSFSTGIQQLKKDLLANKFGAIQKIKSKVIWSRPKMYFTESAWRGKYANADGSYILECIISNAASHYLHNLLFLCGSSLTESAYPTSIEGEGYKIHKIDGYDTVFLRIHTQNQIPLLFTATLAAPNTHEPAFQIQLEDAVIKYPVGPNNEIHAYKSDGTIVSYESPEIERFQHWKKLIKSIQTQAPVPCDINTALPHAVVSNTSIEHIPAHAIDASYIEEDDTHRWIKGIDDIIEKYYVIEQLPSELHIPWAVPANFVQVGHYEHFSGCAQVVHPFDKV